MRPTERVLCYDPSTKSTKVFESDKFEGLSGFQSLDIPPLCNTVTVYIDRGITSNNRLHQTPTEKPVSSSEMANEPVKFALSRSRRIVRDNDLVATISLKHQRGNSWFQRHSPLQPALFKKIIIGIIDDSITASKKRDPMAEGPADESKTPMDRGTPLQG
ncbi:hypothetical protein F5Y10DRAFT_273261 [Nemania abortiva]|nr:hypothetical protein F5Y10DRAFT_273261 [Nemania abortiva]